MGKWNSSRRFRARQFIESEKSDKWYADIAVLFDEDDVIAKMRSKCTQAFLEVFKMGFQNYVQGEWSVARRFLFRTRDRLGFHDGPSDALLVFMESHAGHRAPAGWHG